MPQEQRKQVNYVVVCVNEFAKSKRMPIRDAFQYLYQHKGIAFLTECYDAEHTLSLQDAIEDLTRVCQNNGGMIA